MHARQPRGRSSRCRAAVLGDQEQRLYRRTPCRRVVLVPRQLGHEVSGIAQDAQLTAAGQGMGSSKVAVPVFVGHRAVRPLQVVWIALSYFLNTMLSMATTPAARAGALGVAGRRTVACVSAAHFCARSSRVHHSSIRSRRTERPADRAVPVARPGLLGTPGLVLALRPNS